MNKLLATLTLGVMLAAPMVATAAGADSPRGNLPAAVDQLLAQDMIQQAQTMLKIAGFDSGSHRWRVRRPRRLTRSASTRPPMAFQSPDYWMSRPAASCSPASTTPVRAKTRPPMLRD